MSGRQLQRARLRTIPTGDMKTPVIIHQAEIMAPSVGVDFGRKITEIVKPWWCKITTVSGVTMFDSSNIEQVITHDFSGRYHPDIDKDMVIEYDGEYYKIIGSEDLEERQQFMRLRCTVRGSINKEVNYA